MSDGIDANEGTRPGLSLIMPACNEEAGIQLSIAEAYEALTSLEVPFEIVVVDDGSTDRTAELVDQASSIWPNVRLLQHENNRGYGAALRTGFEAARFERVGFTDADGQFYLEDIERLLERTNRYPIVVGFRIDRQDSWRRRFFSWGYNKLVRLLLGTGVRDCDCALKVFRREVLPFVMPQSTGFLVNAEMLGRARRLGIDIAEVGVRHRPRRHGSSKVSLLDVPRTLAKLLPLWWRLVVRRSAVELPSMSPLPPRSLPLPERSALPADAPMELKKSA